ncbi:MAG: hypothetical protein JZU67_03060, partial [Burkholderiaceae bacterium]|nr:hypothetical protein [Burkholderiaceae bacterium]
MSKPSSSSEKKSAPKQPAEQKSWFLQLFTWVVGIGVAGVASVFIIVAITMAIAYPNLPDISDLEDYRPKLPLRIFSAEGD